MSLIKQSQSGFVLFRRRDRTLNCSTKQSSLRPVKCWKVFGGRRQPRRNSSGLDLPALRHSYIDQKSVEIRNPCTPLWQARQRVIRFCSISCPERLRNSLWWTSRFDIAPQNWHLHPSRHNTPCRSWSYFSALSRQRGAFNQIRFTMLSFRLLAAETHASVHRAGI